MAQKLIQIKIDEELIEAFNEYIKKNNDNAFNPKETKTSLFTKFIINLTKK